WARLCDVPTAVLTPASRSAAGWSSPTARAPRRSASEPAGSARPREPDPPPAQDARVAEMAAEGLSNPQIAQALFVTRRSVETHLRHAFQKLDIRSREKLARTLV